MKIETSGSLFTETTLQRRISLEILEITFFASVISSYSFIWTPQEKFFDISMKKRFFSQTFFRKAGHACNINMKFGHFQKETPPTTKQNVSLELNISPVLMKAHKCRYENFGICSSLYVKIISKKEYC